MIPKIIHYCWFGANPMPETEAKCIESWKLYLPEFKLMLWNEGNFDTNCCDYVREAYSLGKYAFVSDYARALALYQHGGIYFDTDVEVLRSIESFLDARGLLGFENKSMVGTAVMGFERDSDTMRRMLDYYHSVSFIDSNGNRNLTTNVTLLNKILLRKGLIQENSEQWIDTSIHVCERDVFFPKVTKTAVLTTESTVTIHRMSGSWLTDRQLKRGKNSFWINVCRPVLKTIQAILGAVVGRKRTAKLEKIVRNILK